MGKQQAKEVHQLTYVPYVGQNRCSTRPNTQPDCQLSAATVLQPALTEIRQVEPKTTRRLSRILRVYHLLLR